MSSFPFLLLRGSQQIPSPGLLSLNVLVSAGQLQGTLFPLLHRRKRGRDKGNDFHQLTCA